MENKWVFYLIYNENNTYAGVSNNYERRLRQHNQEIKGGAKYTTSKSPNWKHICIIEGFQDKIQAMQFEWAIKHVHPRNAGGIENRIKKLETTLWKEKWTSKSPLSKDIPLVIYWCLEYNITLPDYVSSSSSSNISPNKIGSHNRFAGIP